ncbi:hypothetical protein CR513_46573, partial [Mucuna pruriens]
MLKKEQEGFKEYAQRWCELAVQVQPLITEREMVTMFIDTLFTLYYDKVVGKVASNFADLVVMGERINLGIRRSKPLTAYTNSPPAPYIPPYQSRVDTRVATSSRSA